MERCLGQGYDLTQWLAGLALRLFTGLTALLLAADPPAEGTISRAVANAQAARMLDEHGNSILRLAYSYLHNKSDAEEVLQDTLIRYLETTPAFRDENHEKAWLLRVAANLSKNRIDYNRVRSADALSETLAAEDREDLSEVLEAVNALPPRYREVIHLFYYEGFATAQIAKILDRNEATVRSDLRRARLRLKALLKEAYDFEDAIR